MAKIRLVNRLLCYLAVLLVLSSLLLAELPFWQAFLFALFVFLAYLVYSYTGLANQIISRSCYPFTSEEIWEFLADNAISYQEIWGEKELSNEIEELAEGGSRVGVCKPSVNGKLKTPEDAYFCMHRKGADYIILGRFVCQRLSR